MSETKQAEDKARNGFRRKIIQYLDDNELRGEKDLFRNNLVDYIENIESENESDKSIVEILSKYHVMASLMGSEPIYNEAFLHSSEARRAMLSKHGCLIYKCANKSDEGNSEEQFKVVDLEKYYKLAEDQEAKELKAGGKDTRDRKDELGEMLDTELKNVRENKDRYEVQYWCGCGMSIPVNNVKVVLSFTNAYPCVYIKKKKDGENYQFTNDIEAFIEEGPWSVKYVDVEGILSSGSNEQGKSKYEPTIILKNEEKSNDESTEISVSEALVDCDILIQVPYINPLTDVLTKIRFENRNEPQNEDVIILSCS